MLRARQLLPSLYARLENSLTASTSLAFNAEQRRSKIVVNVQNNKIGLALKQLVSKMKQNNILKEWKAREYFVRPAQQRVLDAKETRRRLAKKRFKATMAAISARQARGF